MSLIVPGAGSQVTIMPAFPRLVDVYRSAYVQEEPAFRAMLLQVEHVRYADDWVRAMGIIIREDTGEYDSVDIMQLRDVPWWVVAE